MNTPFGESEKLALLQADILLLPNSLTIKEIPNPSASLRATHQLELDMKYALADVKILALSGARRQWERDTVPCPRAGSGFNGWRAEMEGVSHCWFKDIQRVWQGN